MAVYSLTIRNRAVALLVTLVVLGAGAALLVVGLALLAALAVAGGVLGAGVLAYRALRGGRAPSPIGRSRAMGLDPSLEVFPERDATARPSGLLESDDPRPPSEPA